MSDTPIVGVIIVIMLCLAAMPPNSFTLKTLEDNGTITCRSVVGEVIGKEAPVTLIVRVDDSVSNSVDTYSVYVSPEAYSNYSVGDSHNEAICTITDYDYYKEIIDALLESGILN